MKYLNLIKFLWQKNSGNYKEFIISPTWLLLVYIAIGSAIIFLIGMLFKDVLPSYYKVANNLPLSDWGWQGWYLTTMLALFAIVAWVSLRVIERCNAIILKRYFK